MTPLISTKFPSIFGTIDGNSMKFPSIFTKKIRKNHAGYMSKQFFKKLFK